MANPPVPQPQTALLSADAPGIERAAAWLRDGWCVGMPTETVYGLAAAAFDVTAVGRVFAAKERPLFDPLIVHVADLADVPSVVAVDRLGPEGRRVAQALWARFWPGPLTLVLPRVAAVPDLVTAGLDTVAVRMPRHPAALALIRAARVPLVAPSANRFGRISPTTARAVLEELGGRIAAVVDGGPCEIGVESTVVAVGPAGELQLLRPGGVPAAVLHEIAPVSTVVGSRASPGHTPSHYAPATPVVLLPDRVERLPVGALPPPDGGVVALLRARDDASRAVSRLVADGHVVGRVVTLSRRGDEAEAARNLFAALRELDASGAARILAEPWPAGDGLGHAIHDRLRRAAGRG